jgi:hypothetical protein
VELIGHGVCSGVAHRYSSIHWLQYSARQTSCNEMRGGATETSVRPTSIAAESTDCRSRCFPIEKLPKFPVLSHGVLPSIDLRTDVFCSPHPQTFARSLTAIETDLCRMVHQIVAVNSSTTE